MGKIAVNRWHTQVSARWPYDDERSDDHHHTFQMSHHRDFKNFFIGYLAHFYKSAFPNSLSYTRFLEVIPTALVTLCSYFATLKSDPTGIEFADSTNIKVCHNLRINRHKTLDGWRAEIKARWFGSMVLSCI